MELCELVLNSKISIMNQSRITTKLRFATKKLAKSGEFTNLKGIQES